MTTSTPNPPPAGRKPKRATVGARIILTFFALILCGAGAGATWMLWHAYQRAAEKYTWTEVPCAIVKSELREEKANLNSPAQWRPVIEYTYLLGDLSCKSSAIRTVDGAFKDKAAAEEVVAKYKAGQSSVCYVNPADPDKAILIRETKAPLYSIWFPLLFVIGGIGMILHVWWPADDEAAEAASEKSESEAAGQP